MTESSNPYHLAAESIFKIKALRDYLRLFGTILRSPTRNTLRAFESLHLSDGIRFLEFSTGLYLLGIAISGLTVYGRNEAVKTIIQPLHLFVTLTISTTLYYLAMRNRGTKSRSPREFMFFACLTLGFTTPIGILQLLGLVGTLAILILTIPLFVYVARTWKYFWGTSGARAFWVYFGCTLAGGIAGELLLIPVYLIFGFPRYS